jgi:Spy/CpxP family protein refolding chaperone
MHARHHEKLATMRERVSLSDEQASQIEQVFDNAVTRHQALREQDAQTRRERFEARRRLHHEVEDSIYALLSPEQREQFRLLSREWREERWGRRFWRRHRRGGRGFGPGPP